MPLHTGGDDDLQMMSLHTGGDDVFTYRVDDVFTYRG